jgi:hypothetical protein
VGPRAGLNDVEKILDPTVTRTPTPGSSSPLPVAIRATLSRLGARGSVVGQRTMLQAGRSRVQVPIRLLDFQLT